MRTEKDILSELETIFSREQGHLILLKQDQSLKQDLHMSDNLIKEVVIQVEEFFEMRMSRKVFLELKTVGDLVTWLKRIL